MRALNKGNGRKGGGHWSSGNCTTLLMLLVDGIHHNVNEMMDGWMDGWITGGEGLYRDWQPIAQAAGGRYLDT